jgi:hypothetical protein
MTTHTLLSEHAVLWRVVMVTPGGYVEVVEVRAPNEATALATVQVWKPYHQVATDPPGNPLIWGAAQGLAARGDAIGGRRRANAAAGFLHHGLWPEYRRRDPRIAHRS